MAPRCCIYLAHRWRIPKLMIALLVLELPLTVAMLVLFGVADGDTYRTKLWQDGSDHHFNSNPNEILYAYANYQPIHVPLVWSQFFTQFNVVCAVLSMFILLVKSTMFVLGAFLPVLSVFVHAVEIAIYAVSVSNQATPDLSNTHVKNLQRNLPWYLSKGCSYATKSTYGYCMQARASFGVAITMLVLFIVFFAVAIHSTIITREEKAERLAEWEEEKDLKQYEDSYDPEEEWEARRQEFVNTPRTPATPWTQQGLLATTPRTTAFNQLNGDISEPSAVYRGGSGSGNSTRPLAFREQYGNSAGVEAR